jgi:hypothetical protein
LARDSSGGSSSPAAALRWPLALVFRQASVSARVAKVRAGSSGAGREARCVQAATATSGARCSTAAAMVAAAGLGVSREEKTGLAFIGGHEAVTEFPCTPRQVESRYGLGTAEGGRRHAGGRRPMAACGRRSVASVHAAHSTVQGTHTRHA